MPFAQAPLTAILLCASGVALAAPPTAPGTPSGSVTGSSVSLSWRAATDDEGVTGYNVYRDGRYLTTVSGTSHVAALGDGGSASFYVTAFDTPADGSARGYSTRSGSASFTRATDGSTDPAPAVPGAPSALRAVRTGASTVRLDWTPAGASDRGYNVYRDDRYVTTVTTPRFEDSTLAPGVAYRYYVVAFDAEPRFSPKSAVAVAPGQPGGTTTPDPAPTPAPGPDTSPPSAAGGVVATASGDGTDVRWAAATDDVGVRGYNVYRNDRFVASVLGTSFRDTSAPAGTAYYVIAYDEARNFGPRSPEGEVGGASAPDPTPDPTPGPAPDPTPGTGELPPASPPTLDEPFADAIPSPAANDPFGYFLEQDVGTPIAGGAPTQPRNLRLDLVSNRWSEFSWAPSADDGAVVAYEITRDDGQTFRLTPELPAGLALDPGTYEEYAKYWATTSFIDCNATRFAFAPGSAKEADAPWNCALVGPRPGDDFSYTVAAIDDEGNRSPESEPISVAYAELIDAPVPFYDDLYLGPNDRFASVTDLSNTAYFLDDFELMFEDEFDRGRIDPANWQTSLVWRDTRIINGEQQYFVDTQRRPDFGYDPFAFDGSGNDGALDGQALTIEATPVPEALRGALPAVCDEADPTGLDRCEFLSGAISSWDRFNFIYGYVEGRIKASPKSGALSSFYLYHRYKGGESDPAFRHGPEIDILEYLGENPFGDEDAFQTYHFVDPNTDIIRSSPTMNVEKNDADASDIYGGEYHTYGVLWEPQLVVWYIDGREVKRLRGPQVSRQPMNVVNYLVTGSGWAPTPDASDFPVDMGVDYIRVYQRAPFTGTFNRQ